MVSGTRAAHDIELTAESLQAELARLQIQKQSLERELAAVLAHLGSVHRALSTLETLMHAPADEAVTAVSPRPDRDAEGHAAAGTDTDGQKKYGTLTGQIMEYFAAVGDVDVRARDVAAALGRDSDSGSINGVRSTLDRLVGASRIRRTGRGLYRAPGTL
ncbi:hypothetical protein [Streptomyces shenzhenensis]|uniref:Uncharacterized protein n=1 Tax=Streptomyces shenzhenensis TaxID=943815 RepID=A0A3M0IDS1_9ACTN|nr:hypothetical protein [Streptomyces shenzhenensis]RMB84943.1 hypothetical protein CTZ28_15055 [Streptomyces shenzhenensis]